MTNRLFVELVHKHFDFLVNEYGYVIDNEYQSHDRYNSGYVKFKSLATMVQVEKDGGNILVSIAPVGEPEISKQYLPTILEAFSYSRENDFPDNIGPEEYEKVLRTYSALLKKDCKSFLKGDFSRWVDILRFNIEKRKKDYLSWSGKELPIETFSKLEDYIRSNDQTNKSST